jgi:hypothetical protein
MRKLSIFALLVLILSISFSQLASAQAGGANPQLIMNRYNSNSNGAIPVNPTDTIGTVLFNALSAPNTILTGASIRSFITGPVSATSLPANLVFRTGAAGPLNRMVVTSDGLVGIGTMTPGFNLDVVGNTHTSGDFYGRIHVDKNLLTNAAPNTYNDETYFELKQRSVLAVPGVSGPQGGLMTIAPGGTSFDHQLFFGDDGIYARRWTGNATNWTGSVWNKILTGEDIHGTLNHVAKFTSANSLGDSQIWDDATGVAINASTVTPGFRFDVNGNTKIRGNELLTGALSVGGASTLSGAVAASNTLSVAGATTLSGQLTVNNATNVTGATTVGGLLTVNNNANVTGTVQVSSNANVGGALDVTGTTHLNGKVAIGTTSTPGTHALYVGGSMIATEVKVALQASWPDYVFDEKTAAPDPMAWDQYIKANKHLPGIPSAQEVAQNGGFELGENQRLLLEKVEQLTLMLIEQQKQIETLKAAVNSCKE